MVYKSQLIGYKKPTDHQNLSVFQLPYENQPFELSSFLTVSVFWLRRINIRYSYPL